MACLRRTLHKTRLPESDENDPDGISDAAHLPPPRSPLLSIPDPSQSPRKGLPGESDAPKVDYNQVWTKGGAGGTPRSAQSTPTRSLSRMHFGNGATGGGNGGRLPPSGCGRERGSSSRAARAIADGKCCQPTDIRHFELDEDPSFWNEHNVQVLIRIRPISSAEKAIQGHGICLRQESSQTLTWTGHPEARFTFDHIACETISQENLFKAVGVPMVENCMSGYNSCLFAYGQTGSGKTYTMMGEIRDLDSMSCGDRGITPRIFEYLFTRIREEEENRKHEKLRYSCKCSYLEIYNEQITDLLDPLSTNLQLREDVKKGVYVENLKEHDVHTVKDVIELLLQGTSNRKIAATSMNSESSRSHSVFTCSIESHWERDSMTHLRFGRLNLVDLAGSERQKSSGAEGEWLKEAANINKSLSTLGLVIMTLVDIANGKHRHVPYRDSRLTFLLQDSLGGNSKTTIIATVSPSICSANETLSTLKFAQRAKLIQNNAKVNEDASGDIMALQREIQRLRDQLNVVTKQQNAPRLEPPSIYESAKVDDIIDNSGTLEGGSTCSLNDLSFFDCKMKFLKSALASSLRRENMAEVKIRTLETEIEHMKQLVQQMKTDVSRMETMLHLRDETIRKLELVSDGLLCGDKYLSEKNYALSMEIQLLREKINQNPEQILLSLENIRLHEELRVCQDFYQRERDTLVNEISQLRNQLFNISEGEQAEANMSFRTDNQGHTDCSNLSSGSVEVSHDFTREAEDLCFQKKLQLPFCLSPCKEVVLPSKNQTAFQAGLSVVQLPLTDNISGSKITLLARQQENNDIAECEDPRTAPLLVKMRKIKKELERSMKLNVQLENEKHTHLSKFADMEQIREQVEVETVQTILNLQQELVVLQQQACSRQVDDFSGEGTSSPVLLKLENMELMGRLHQITKTNVELLDCVAAKDAQIHLIANAWEKAVIDLTSFLLDGCQSLEDASSEIHSIIGSFPQCETWISDHVERAIKTFIEKERLIVSLQKSLEDAQKLCHEMTSKLDCLKGATIAITEVEQIKYGETSNELLCLRALLNEKMCTNQELEDTLKLKDNQIIDAEKKANAAFIAMKTLNEMACEIPYHARMDGEVTNGNKKFQEPILMSRSTQELSQILHALEWRIENNADSFRSLESLQLKLNDSGKIANEKAKLAANLFVKFEEAQETMKEADLILNELLKANETARLNTEKWKHENQILQMDNASLTAEVEHMRTEVAIHERHNEILIDEIDAAITEMSKLMAELEEFFQFVQNHTESEFRAVHSGISVVAMEVCEFIQISKTSFEALFSEILQKKSPSRAMRWHFQTGKTLKSSQEVFDGKESKDGCYVVCEFPSLAGAEEALKMFQESLVKSISCSGAMKGELSDAVSATKEASFQGIMLKEEALDPIKMSDISLNSLPEQGHCDLCFRGSLSGDLKHTVVMDKSTKEIRATTDALVKVQQELAVSITQVDELLQHQKELDAQLVNSEFSLSRSRLELKETKDVLDMLVKENNQLTLLLEDVSRKKMDMEELLNDQEKVIESLEREIICLSTSVDDRIFSSTQEMMDKFKLVSKERDQLQEEVVHLNEKFEMASALADENEAIAIEAHQEAEASKVYAEEKEEEVKVLENSVEELECTINVLEEKVIDMGKEVESCRQIRESLEQELQTLRGVFVRQPENAVDIKDSSAGSQWETNNLLWELSVSKKHIWDLERERECQAKEIKRYKEHISEIILHSEAQSSVYQQKFQTLEAMVCDAKKCRLPTSDATSMTNKTDQSSTRQRGAGSPFSCISSLVQQMNSEKDHELSVAKNRIQELEALATDRQKQVCMLSARLAAVDNMTHDVIRDLLEVKLDMANYANLIDLKELHKLLENDWQQSRRGAKDEEISMLKAKVIALVEENNSLVERTRAEILAKEEKLEKIHHRDQLLTAQNEMLKLDKFNLTRKITELDEMMKTFVGSQSIQELISPNAQEKDFLRQNKEFASRLAESDKLLQRTKTELASYSTRQ